MKLKPWIAIFDLILFFWLLAPFLPTPVAPKHGINLLPNPMELLAARTYNGTSDTGSAVLPNLSSYKKIWYVFWMYVPTAWPTGVNKAFASANASFDATPGAFDTLTNPSGWNTPCSTSAALFIRWTTGNSSTQLVAHTAQPSVNAWHRYAIGMSVPAVNGGTNAQFYGFIDGTIPLGLAVGSTSCSSGLNVQQTTFQSSGTASFMSGGASGFFAGSIADFAIFASTDNTAGNGTPPAGWHGAGLPTGPGCGIGPPCTPGGDISAFQLYSANSPCISARPIAFWPQLGADSASGTDPDWSGNAHNMTLTGTTAATIPAPPISPCPNGLNGN